MVCRTELWLWMPVVGSIFGQSWTNDEWRIYLSMDASHSQHLLLFLSFALTCVFQGRDQTSVETLLQCTEPDNVLVVIFCHKVSRVSCLQVSICIAPTFIVLPTFDLKFPECSIEMWNCLIPAWMVAICKNVTASELKQLLPIIKYVLPEYIAGNWQILLEIMRFEIRFLFTRKNVTNETIFAFLQNWPLRFMPWRCDTSNAWHWFWYFKSSALISSQAWIACLMTWIPSSAARCSTPASHLYHSKMKWLLLSHSTHSNAPRCMFVNRLCAGYKLVMCWMHVQPVLFCVLMLWRFAPSRLTTLRWTNLSNNLRNELHWVTFTSSSVIFFQPCSIVVYMRHICVIF